MTPDPALELVTPAGARLALTRAALRGFPPAQQVADVGLLVPGKQGRAVWLAALLERCGGAGGVAGAGAVGANATGAANATGVAGAANAAGLTGVAGARFLNLQSSDPSFSVSLPLEELPRGALVVYELDGEPLPDKKGGPFRLLVPGHADECVHVKSLARIELASTRGRDTRPADDEAHRALHAKKKQA